MPEPMPDAALRHVPAANEARTQKCQASDRAEAAAESLRQCATSQGKYRMCVGTAQSRVLTTPERTCTPLSAEPVKPAPLFLSQERALRRSLATKVRTGVDVECVAQQVELGSPARAQGMDPRSRPLLPHRQKTNRTTEMRASCPRKKPTSHRTRMKPKSCEPMRGASTACAARDG
eukprot:1814824-Pleurochrysis_carterae.AAC.2